MSKKIILAKCAALRGASFEVEFWDNDRVQFGVPPHAFLIRFREPNILGRLITTDVMSSLGDAYMDGMIEVDGDLQTLLKLILTRDTESLSNSYARTSVASGGKEKRAIKQAARDIAHHYDIGNNFFARWLGDAMSYSTAYFHSFTDSLDIAQQNKFDYVSRKLQLRPGVSLLDVGCGWGGFIIHAASKYGAHCLGITLSGEQESYTAKRLAILGLSDHARVCKADYREVDPHKQFDRVSSVGMVEHVGRDQLAVYARATASLLKPGGIGFIETMGHAREAGPYQWIGRHIFPGHYLPQIDELLLHLGRAGLEVWDVENLRHHYALTVERWIDSYSATYASVVEERGERFARMWRMYLHALAAGFKYGDMKLWQITFFKGDNELPLTRTSIYTQ